MTIEEVYAPVTHKHNGCPVCNNEALIQDVTPVRSDWDRLMASLRNMQATVRVMTGKKIEVKEG